MEFEVKPGKLNAIASDEREICSALNNLKSDLEICRKNLMECLSSAANPAINKAINNVSNSLEITADTIGIMGDKLDTIANMYSHTESAIVGHAINAESVSKAKNYNADGSAKTDESYLKLLLKLLGIDGTMDENMTDIASLISKILEKINDKSAFTLVGTSMAYGNDLWNFLYKTATGQIDRGVVYDLAKDGSGIWKGMYKYLDKNLAAELNKSMPKEFAVDTVLGNKFGNTIGYVALIASLAGLLKKYDETLEGDNKSFSEKLGEYLGVGEKGIGAAESIYDLSHMSKGVVSKAAKEKGGWFTLGETILSTGGQAFSSYGKYNQDGRITVTEGAEIALESSVSGLTTLISGVTGGLIDIDSDTASAALEDWGKKKGTSIGETIAQNPKMKEMFQNGNFFEQVAAFGWGVAKNQIDKKVESVKKVYNAAQKVGIAIAEEIIN